MAKEKLNDLATNAGTDFGVSRICLMSEESSAVGDCGFCFGEAHTGLSRLFSLALDGF